MLEEHTLSKTTTTSSAISNIFLLCFFWAIELIKTNDEYQQTA